MAADFLDTRLAKALSHPIRMRILETLAVRGEGSPRSLATELGERLPNVSYHVRTLHELGLLELTHTEPRGGAIEHFYKPAGTTHVDDAAWERLPLDVRRRLAGGTVARIVESISAAAGSGGFDRPDAHVSWTPMSLDPEGREAVAELLADLVGKLAEIQRESNERSGTDGESSEVALVHLSLEPGS